MLNPIPLLDEENNIIGETTIPEAFAAGYWRRGAKICLVNDLGEVLLQRRSKINKAYPDRWDLAAGGHVDVGETDLESAVRELQEELGITTKLHQVLDGFKSIIPEDKTFCSLFVGTISSATNFTLQEHEVSATKWVLASDLDALMETRPEQFVPLCIHMWQAGRDKIIPS